MCDEKAERKMVKFDYLLKLIIRIGYKQRRAFIERFEFKIYLFIFSSTFRNSKMVKENKTTRPLTLTQTLISEMNCKHGKRANACLLLMLLCISVFVRWSIGCIACMCTRIETSIEHNKNLTQPKFSEIDGQRRRK